MIVKVENSFSVALLAVMSLLPLLELAGREMFGRGIPGSIPIVQHLTLWIAFLGAALAARSERLLALSTATFLPVGLRRPMKIFTSALGAAIAVCLLLASLDLLLVEREAGGEVAWGIPVWVALCIMPVGFGVIASRLIWHAAETRRGRLLATSALAIPVVLGLFPSLQAVELLVPGLVLILLATALGLPIFAALGGAALLLFWSDGIPVAAVPVETYRLSATPML
ncbi:MAG: TRAP transporter small permease, partial [Nitrospiraceae bacterium]